MQALTVSGPEDRGTPRVSLSREDAVRGGEGAACYPWESGAGLFSWHQDGSGCGWAYGGWDVGCFLALAAREVIPDPVLQILTCLSERMDGWMVFCLTCIHGGVRLESWPWYGIWDTRGTDGVVFTLSMLLLGPHLGRSTDVDTVSARLDGAD